MPVTRVKRSRTELEAEESNVKEGTSKNKKQKQGLSRVLVLYEFDRMDYHSDKWHTLIRTIPEGDVEFSKVTSRIVCSFLNGSGGILCFGCRSNGRIYGEKINRKEEDNLRLLIDEALKRFHPFISPCNYRINFIPVKSRYNTSSTPNCVLEIKVEKGDPYELYETEYHEVFLRTDEGEPYGPLSPHEIKRHVVQQYKKKLESKSNLCNMLKDKKKVTAHVRPLKRDTATTTSVPVNKTPSVPHPLTISQKAVIPTKVCTSESSLQSTKDSAGMDNEAKDSLKSNQETETGKDSNGLNNKTKTDASSLGTNCKADTNSAKESSSLGTNHKAANSVKESSSLGTNQKAANSAKESSSLGTNQKAANSAKESSSLGTNHKAANKSRPTKGQPSTYVKKSHHPFILPPPPPPPPPCAYHNNGPFHYPGYQPHFIPPAHGYSAGCRNHGYYYYH